MSADQGDGLYVPVYIDIHAKGGTPDQLVEQLISERNRFYPEWEFDAQTGIVVTATRDTHVSVQHSATATLTRLVRYRGPDPGD